MTSTTAKACADALFSVWVSRFGVPAVITSDHGPQFSGSVWSALCLLLGVQHGPQLITHKPMVLLNGFTAASWRTVYMRAWPLINGFGTCHGSCLASASCRVMSTMSPALNISMEHPSLYLVSFWPPMNLRPPIFYFAFVLQLPVLFLPRRCTVCRLNLQFSCPQLCTQRGSFLCVMMVISLCCLRFIMAPTRFCHVLTSFFAFSSATRRIQSLWTGWNRFSLLWSTVHLSRLCAKVGQF